MKSKNPHTKNLMFRNPITDYSSQVLQRDKQTGFTQHLVSEFIRYKRIHAKHSKLGAGFIPMIIMIIVIIVAIIWLAYSRVSSTN